MKTSSEGVRAAKEAFKKRFPNVQSPGITGNADEGFKLAVRVATQSDADKIPKEINGVSILCRVIALVEKS